MAKMFTTFDFDNVDAVAEELRTLQKYKLAEGDKPMWLCEDVVEVLKRHIKSFIVKEEG